MVRGRRKVGSSVENSVADRRNHTLLRRSLSQNNNNKVASKEPQPQLSALVLRNSEQRCIVFTWVALELGAYWKVAALIPSLQVTDWKNHLGSGAVSGPNNLEEVSPPTIIFQVNLQKTQESDFSESTCSPKPSACGSSGTRAMGQSRNRSKRTKPLKASSDASSPPSLVGDNSSASVCDSLSAVASDAVVDDIPKMEKSVKRSSRKKGKKKGKQQKQSTHKKVYTELESQCEESTCGASAVKTSINNKPACSSKQLQETNLPENANSLSFAGDYITTEKDDGETNDYVDSSTTMMSCISYDDMDESEPVSSFPQDCWNSDIDEQCSNIVQKRLSTKDKNGPDFLREVVSDSTNYDSFFHMTTGNSYIMNSQLPNGCNASDHVWTEDAGKPDNSTETTGCSSQVCITDDFHPVISGKRGRTARKLNSRTGKDNNHHVWQKVQKRETEFGINELKNVSVVSSQADVSSKDTRARLGTFMGQKQNPRGKTGRYPHSYELPSQTSKAHSFKVSSYGASSRESNVEKISSSASKQANCYSKKGSHNGNINGGRPSKSQVQQKEGFKILPQTNHSKQKSSGLSCPSSNDSHSFKPTEKVVFCQSEQQQKPKQHIDETLIAENMCGTVRDISSSAAYDQMGSLLTALDSSAQTHIDLHSDSHTANGCKDVHEDIYLMDSADSGCRKLLLEHSQPECSELDCNPAPLLQKWVPVGRKDAVVCEMSCMNNLTASVTDKSVPEKAETRNSEEELCSKVHFLPLTGDELQYLSPSPGQIDFSSCETDQLTGKSRNHLRTDWEIVDSLGESNCHLTREVKDQTFSGLETDLLKIIDAVNNTKKLQTAAESVRLITGKPIAEFERFIQSASPVISQRYRSRSCISCSQDQLINNSLCLHQIRNISLESLWQWYEKPGCYGLEVMAESNRYSRGLCSGFLEFKAYFVPYLSAVQLFGRSGTCHASSRGQVMVSHEVDMTSKSSSYLGSLPMLSTPLSQSRKEADSCLRESSPPAKEEFSNHSARGTSFSDGELIFEYFEDAQPQQRRPLFEKIKELVSSETSSSSQIYGDPLNLECSNVHDLHPASWYSVAWYPIYRIPEGNFRAAFLTYHSLGHFIHQSASPNVDGGFIPLVSPVVGLQSYNAKRECWFQPRGSTSKTVKTNETSSLNPSEILEERLRTLEHTASVMSTAIVCKGNQRSVNKHPDYNHFFSRW